MNWPIGAVLPLTGILLALILLVLGSAFLLGSDLIYRGLT